MLRLPLAALAVLVALSGCAVPSTAERDFARARQADSLGHSWTAYRLYRFAGYGGNLWAQVHLSSSYERLPGPTPGGRYVSEDGALFSPVPGPSEAARWADMARANAERLAAEGDADGHRVLGMYALTGPHFGISNRATPEAASEARRHFEAAVALGSAPAAQDLAYTVMASDGMLASEPYFKKSAEAGNRDAAGMLSLIAMNRPGLERGLRSRDHVGDLSLLDVVGSLRVLRTAGDPEAARRANEQVLGIREQAQAGNAEADSLLRAIDAAGLLGSRI